MKRTYDQRLIELVRETGDLEDEPFCPRFSPHRLTADEIRTMRGMVKSAEYRHVPTARHTGYAHRPHAAQTRPALDGAVRALAQ